MKIRQWVTVEQEVTVEVSIEDIAAAIATSRDALPSVLRGINNCYSFMKAVPDSMIARMNEHQLDIVRVEFQKQVDRYKRVVNDADPGDEHQERRAAS